jgi:hypothetical protein
MRPPTVLCPTGRGRSRPGRPRTAPGRPCCCSVQNTVRNEGQLRTPSDDAVREGTVVLVGDVRESDRANATCAAVRRVGDSVLLLGARDAPEPRAAEAPPQRLSKFHAPEIVFGADSVQEAAHAAVRLGARRPFVVTDPGLLDAGWPSELLTHPSATGLIPHLWFDVTPNPKDHEIGRLGDEVGVPTGLGDLGVTCEDVPRLAQLTLSDACLTTNPRPASFTEVAELFRAAL